MKTPLLLDLAEGKTQLTVARCVLDKWKRLDPERRVDGPEAALREHFDRARDLAANPWLEIRAELVPELPEWIQQNYSDASIPLQDALADLAGALHDARLAIARHYGRNSEAYSEIHKLTRKSDAR